MTNPNQFLSCNLCAFGHLQSGPRGAGQANLPEEFASKQASFREANVVVVVVVVAGEQWTCLRELGNSQFEMTTDADVRLDDAKA